MKRLFLWIATNIAVILVLSIILRITGLDKSLNASNGYLPLLFGCAIIGFGGSFFSLLMSKRAAIHGMGVQLIKNPKTELEMWLVETVRRQAETAGIGMPDVGIFNSPDPNAFATGASRNSSLVAVSTGLIDNMDRGSVEAVLGHEISHVANGDMVTMTLLQGVMNTFVVFFARVIASIVTSNRDSEESNSNSGMFFLVTMVLQIVFGVLAGLITSAFSRHREFKADEGGANLASNQKMISALEALGRREQRDLPGELAAFGISGGIASLFSTHPPLEKRIEALKARQFA